MEVQEILRYSITKVFTSYEFGKDIYGTDIYTQYFRQLYVAYGTFLVYQYHIFDSHCVFPEEKSDNGMGMAFTDVFSAGCRICFVSGPGAEFP